MSKRVLILHGWGGSDYPHWQSWLAGEIAKEYGCVNFLKFSNFNEPKLDIWMHELKVALEEFKPHIIICHSLANTLWFHFCNRHKNVDEVETLFLIAPPSNSCEIDELQEFFPVELPQNIHAKELLLVASTNDPYITMNEIRSLEKNLHCKTDILRDAGHINTQSGYGEWEWIKEELKKRKAF